MAIEPSANFLSKFVTSFSTKKLVELTMKQFEIYNYFGEKVPKYFTDNDWERMLKLNTPKDRVSFWIYTATKQRRHERDRIKKEQLLQRAASCKQAQLDAYNAGGMGYGSSLYRLTLNPLRNYDERDKIYNARFVSAYLVNDLPNILLDTQYINGLSENHTSQIGKQVEHIFHEHWYHVYRPLPLEIINLNSSYSNRSHFLSFLGCYNRSENRSKILIPELHEDNPYHDKILNNNNVPEEEQIVYISRYAKDVLDGPLRHKSYVIPITFDKNKESLGVCRTKNYRMMSLPIDKYVKWQSGKKVIPFVNIYKIFASLCSNGCNWENALQRNIAAHHFVPMQELLKTASHFELKNRAEKENLQKIVQLIEEASRK